MKVICNRATACEAECGHKVLHEEDAICKLIVCNFFKDSICEDEFILKMKKVLNEQNINNRLK